MIDLKRLVELRGDQAVVEAITKASRHGMNLVNDGPGKELAEKGCVCAPVEDMVEGAIAAQLAVYEEARRPLLELLSRVDKAFKGGLANEIEAVLK